MPPLQTRAYRCIDQYGRRHWCGLSTGAKWGIAWAAIAGGLFLLFMLGFLRRRRRANMIAVTTQPQPQYPQPPQGPPYPVPGGVQPYPQPGPQHFTMPQPAVPLGSKQCETPAWNGPSGSPMTAAPVDNSGATYPPPPGPPPPAYQAKE